MIEPKMPRRVLNWFQMLSANHPALLECYHRISHASTQNLSEVRRYFLHFSQTICYSKPSLAIAAVTALLLWPSFNAFTAGDNVISANIRYFYGVPAYMQITGACGQTYGVQDPVARLLLQTNEDGTPDLSKCGSKLKVKASDSGVEKDLWVRDFVATGLETDDIIVSSEIFTEFDLYDISQGYIPCSYNYE